MTGAMKKFKGAMVTVLVVSLLATVGAVPLLADNHSGEKAEAKTESLVLSPGGTFEKFRYFSLTTPPRLVVDIYGSGFDIVKGAQPLSSGFKQFRVGEYKDKIRYVFDADGEALPAYTVQRVADDIQVTWSADQTLKPMVSQKAGSQPVVTGDNSVLALDFGVKGNDSVFKIGLQKAGTLIPAEVNGRTIIFGVKNAYLKPSLRRYIDPSAFPSIVSKITPYVTGKDARFAVELRETSDFDLRMAGNELIFNVPNGKWAFQKPADKTVAAPSLTSGTVVETIDGDQPPVLQESASAVDTGEVSGQVTAPVSTAMPLTEPLGALGKKQKQYTGEKISLVFDSAKVRNVLQLIAEVSNMNIIASKDVKGTVTLRLIDVPWDQALDVILDVTELGMLQDGNVIRILPSKKIRSLREAELTSLKAQEKLEPLSTEVFKISYTDLKNIKKAVGDVLSDRGKITEDARNKQLIVSDVPARLAEARKLIDIIDTPEKQVLISARIVEVDANFSRELGINWSLNWVHGGSDTQEIDIGGGGDFSVPTQELVDDGIIENISGFSTLLGVGHTTASQSIIVAMQISALEEQGKAKTIAAPKVVTLNGEEAKISQGTSIPYSTISDSGTKVQFIDATLELKVTPVINPDGSVILDIKASNNSPSALANASVPGIDKKETETKVLVQDGETTVVGGIFTEDTSEGENGVPILKDVPVLGHLFKASSKSTTQTELLVFITPRILN